MVSDDELLERIVAGICEATMNGAEVQWSEKIGGREFDVIVKFQNGPFTFLCLIEVRDKKHPIEVGEVEAFVTKANDKGANKIAIFSSSGFQSGCLDVAERHGVELYKIGHSDSPPDDASIQERLKEVHYLDKGRKPITPPHLTFSRTERTVLFDKVTLTYVDYGEISLPAEPTQMEYVAKSTRIGNRYIDYFTHSLDVDFNTDAPQSAFFEFSRPVSCRPVDELFIPAGLVKKIEIDFVVQDFHVFSGNVRLERTSITYPIITENIRTGETASLNFWSILLGFQPFEAGKFYCYYGPIRYCYCARVDDGVATVYLIESYQNARDVTAVITANAATGRHAIEVRDKKILARLRKRLDQFRTKRGITEDR